MHNINHSKCLYGNPWHLVVNEIRGQQTRDGDSVVQRFNRFVAFSLFGVSCTCSAVCLVCSLVVFCVVCQNDEATTECGADCAVL